MEELEAIREAEEAALLEAENAAKEAVAALESLLADENKGFIGDEDGMPAAKVRADCDNEIFSVAKAIAATCTLQSANTAIPFEGEVDYEGPDYKKTFCQNLTNIVDIFCTWDFGREWIKVTEVMAWIVFDPFTELFITLCIIVNVAFLALDHYDIRYEEGM